MAQKKITRRQALKSLAAGAAGSMLLNVLPWKVFARKPAKKSRVILIRDKELLSRSGKISSNVLEDMLDKAVTALTGDNEANTAWQKFIKPDDVVGIKSNEWSNLPTPAALEQHIKKRVMEVGVSENDISIDDRGILSDPVFKRATALINSRPMRTHDWSGVGSLIKNYIMFTEKPYEYHPDTCANLAELWKKPMVKGKTRLNILVMITPLFHGVGPHHFNEKYTWAYNGLIVSTDPVAADATGLRIIEAKRTKYFGEERPVTPSPHHIQLADTRHNLGNAAQENIELVKMGWKENMLI